MAEAEPRLLLLIDDQPEQCRRIAGLASREGWRTMTARDLPTAIATLSTRDGMRLSAIMVDEGGLGNHVCERIAELRTRRPELPILLVTASASPLLAVEAMRAGATDYLIKPVAPERLVSALRVAANAGGAEELQPLAEKMPGAAAFEAMIGSAPRFRSALAIAAKSARAHGAVLIEGESGTGKEMLVRAMHAASPRARQTLRLVNLAGFAPAQVEPLLFGHERGAFPGAFNRQPGVFQHAEGGTLVLDEIDRLALSAQDKLVAFLAGGTIQPLGARHRLRIDVRLLACSNADLAALAKAGLFREDLLRLLAPTLIHLPPLRERAGDIPALARHFLAQIAEQPGLRPLGITDAALALLAAYEWPGNVRQLQAVLFRAAVFCDGNALTGQDFPNLAAMVGEPEASSPASATGGGVTLFQADGNLRPLEDIEADVIRLAIGHYRGQMSEVARRLGIGRSTLYRKLAQLGMDHAA